MHCVENKTTSPIFLTKFFKLSHTYLTIFSAYILLVPTSKLKKNSYRISVRGPLFWDNILAAAKSQERVFNKKNTFPKQEKVG